MLYRWARPVAESIGYIFYFIVVINVRVFFSFLYRLLRDTIIIMTNENRTRDVVILRTPTLDLQGFVSSYSRSLSSKYFSCNEWVNILIIYANTVVIFFIVKIWLKTKIFLGSARCNVLYFIKQKKQGNIIQSKKF